MFKVERLPFLHRAVDDLLDAGSVVRMSSLEYERQCRLIGSIAFKDAKGFLRPVKLSARNVPTEAARMAQPLRFGQIGLAALQLGGPLRHLRLELIVGFAKLLLALADRFLDARRTKCGCRVIRGYGEQQLVDFGGKIGVITRRSNQTPLGSNADGNDNTAALPCAAANVANDFAARQTAINGEMTPQPFRECLPCASPRDFNRGTPARITQPHKSKVEVQ